MSINKSIVDQHVEALIPRILQYRPDISSSDPSLKSKAFVALTLLRALDIDEQSAFDAVTDGSRDFGLDAIYIGDVQDSDFTVYLVQGKYYSGDRAKNFDQGSLEKMLQAVDFLFDPKKNIPANGEVLAKAEEIRSLIREGYIPQINVIFCSNGEKWREDSQHIINEKCRLNSQIDVRFINHDELIQRSLASKPVQEQIQLVGKATVENFAFRRVLVGKIAASEILRLFEKHGEKLLERNIRRYLGLHNNRVNTAIAHTLEQERENFYFYNNGITVVCDKFRHNESQLEDLIVKIEDMQIINGGQTCNTIHQTLAGKLGLYNNAYTLIRIYELAGKDDKLVGNITFATNNQNPVDLRDLRSNDPVQQQLALSIEGLGYEYRRQRSDQRITEKTITIATAAEAILSVWRHEPHLAKFKSSQHFDGYYTKIFNDGLNGAQVVIAVLLYRISENFRKRPEQGMPEFVRYASCFAAMLMASSLFEDLNITRPKLTHKNFKEAEELIHQKGREYYLSAIKTIKNSLDEVYRDSSSISLQQMSAIFRSPSLVDVVLRKSVEGTFSQSSEN